MDVAASEFAVGEIGAGKRPGYDLAKKQPGSNGAGVVTGEALQALYEGMLAKYPIISIEDPFEQEVGVAAARARAQVSPLAQHLTSLPQRLRPRPLRPAP
jgi:enolase